jgi:hypothetical protein
LQILTTGVSEKVHGEACQMLYTENPSEMHLAKPLPYWVSFLSLDYTDNVCYSYGLGLYFFYL